MNTRETITVNQVKDFYKTYGVIPCVKDLPKSETLRYIEIKYGSLEHFIELHVDFSGLKKGCKIKKGNANIYHIVDKNKSTVFEGTRNKCSIEHPEITKSAFKKTGTDFYDGLLILNSLQYDIFVCSGYNMREYRNAMLYLYGKNYHRKRPYYNKTTYYEYNQKKYDNGTLYLRNEEKYEGVTKKYASQIKVRKPRKRATTPRIRRK